MPSACGTLRPVFLRFRPQAVTPAAFLHSFISSFLHCKKDLLHNGKERKSFRHDVGDGALDVPARSGHMRKKCSASTSRRDQAICERNVRRLRTICEITEHFLESCFPLLGEANLSPTGGDRVMCAFCNTPSRRCLKSPRENVGEAISLPAATQKYLKKLDESEQISNSSNFSND